MSYTASSDEDATGPSRSSHTSVDSPRGPNEFLKASEDDLNLSKLFKALRDDNSHTKYNLELPWIVVCGSQSAGKSSVLRAITKIPFKVGTEMCTRFVTKIITQPSEITDKPGKSQLRAEIERVDGPGNQHPAHFAPAVEEWDGQNFDVDFERRLNNIMDNASQVILTAVPEQQYGKYRISSDILKITLSMPGIKNLAIVDLPGLIGDDDDTGAKEQIEDITRNFIRRQDSLVVTVIPAASDAGGVDTAARTLRDRAEENFNDRSVCVITKPDVAKLHVATEQAKSWESALRDQDRGTPQYKGRFHVLMNWSAQGVPNPQEETAFFEDPKNPWSVVDYEKRGAEQLALYLGTWQQGKWRQNLPRYSTELRRLLHDILQQESGLNSDDSLQTRVSAFRYMHSTLHSKIVEHLSDNNRSVNQIKDGKAGPTLLRPATTRQEQFFVDDLIQYAFRNRSFICPEDFGPRGASVRPHALHRDTAPAPPQEWLKWPVDQWTTEKQEIEFFVEKLKDQMGPEGQAQVNHRFVEDLYRYMSVRFHDIAEHHRLVMMSTIRRYFEETILYFLENPYGDTIHKPFLNAEKLARRFYSSFIEGDVVKRGSEAKVELKRLELDRKDIMLSIDAEAYNDRVGFKNLKRFKESHRASIVLLAATAMTSHDPEPADQEKHARAAGIFEEKEILAANAEENAYVAYKTYQRGRYVWGQNVIYQVFERRLIRDLQRAVDFTVTDKEIEDILDETTQEDKKKKNDLAFRRRWLEEHLRMIEKYAPGVMAGIKDDPHL